MRPKKIRVVGCSSKERYFFPKARKPKSFPSNGIILMLDEFEAIRLAHVEGLIQEDAARRMGISRSTFSRIISSANGKLGKALVNMLLLKVEGGCCKFRRKMR